MGIKQLYYDNLRKLPNEYGDVSVMDFPLRTFSYKSGKKIVFGIGPQIKRKMSTANV